MTADLIASAFLFRLSVACQQSDKSWSAKGIQLSPKYTIPSFRSELDKGPKFADLRIGWSESGLSINLRTEGKKQAPWCRDSRIEDSDGLSLWIDTRNTQNIHRASRFCHRFVCLPQGSGAALDEPIISLVDIHRAKEPPKPIRPGMLKIRSERRVDGYLLEAFIPGECLTGWDPSEHQRLGFFYAIADRELGWQTFSLGPEFPFSVDPSLWGTLELERF